MRLAMIAGLALVVSAGSPAPEATRLTFAPQVLRQWAMLYREFSVEFATCLYGRHDTVTLAIPADVRPRRATSNVVTPEGYSSVTPFGGCPHVGVPLIADGHSHPVKGAVRRDRCYLSPADVTAFRREVASGAPFTVVICDFGEVAVFFRSGTVRRCHYDPNAHTPTCVWREHE
jgi:hypothetical protein